MKVFSMLVLLLLFPGILKAEEGRLFLGLIERLKTELALTDEQVVRITPFVKKNVLKRQTYLDSLQGSPITNNKEFKRISRKLKKELNQDLAEILTPEQMQKLIEKQNIRESLNKDLVDFSEGLSGESFNPQGASLAF